jgi:hypothetical protein
MAEINKLQGDLVIADSIKTESTTATDTILKLLDGNSTNIFEVLVGGSINLNDENSCTSI